MAALRVVTYDELDPANIKKARELSGLSGRELARRIGVHSNLISRIENGRIQEIPEAIIKAMTIAMQGEGWFEQHSSDVVFGVMKGEVSFQPRLVEDGPAIDSDTNDEVMGRHLRSVPDLDSVGSAAA